jgi:dihydrofolate synthase/folylpolyglutamate synthase
VQSSTPLQAEYPSLLAWLYSLQPRGVRLGLERIHAALREIGSPHEALRAVHVAGTNGKGSVSAMVAAAARSGRYRVGLYTSPHLHRFVERIQIDGACIDEAEVATRLSKLRTSHPALVSALTFFEMTTLVAFWVFAEHACDLVVLETGLGGRLDATNVVAPLVSAITEIGLDHTDRLGETLDAIAGEKAGIIKPHVPVVVGARAPQAVRVLHARAEQLHAPVFQIDRDFGTRSMITAGHARDDEMTDDVAFETSRFNVSAPNVRQTHTWGNVHSPLRGVHQRRNLACALQTLDVLRGLGYAWEDHAIGEALAEATWPGRFEVVHAGPEVIVDAAHNAQGAEALLAALESRREERAPRARRVLLFAAMTDKDYAAMLSTLCPYFGHVVFAPLDMTRAAPPHVLAQHATGDINAHLAQSSRVTDAAADSVPEALAKALHLATPQGLVVVTGSIFLVAQVRAELLGIASDPLIAM